MGWFKWRPRARPTHHAVLRLRPSSGFGDHLMLSAVLEGIRAERPEISVHVAAIHPEIFWHNPHVESVVLLNHLARQGRERLEEYLHVHPRPPEERHAPGVAHLIDDMYRCVGIAVAGRPHQPRIYLTARERRFRRGILEGLARPRIAIVPHGNRRALLPNKLYPAAQWEAVAHRLGDLGGALVQLGTADDGPLLPGAVDMMDIGFRRTAAVLERCDLLVTPVGGIMHLAAAVGTPAVVLYGAAEHPEVSGYPQNRNLYVPIECGPCWMRTPCSHHSCMKRLEPEIVVEEVRAALAGAPLPPHGLVICAVSDHAVGGDDVSSGV
jgi:ADP-heptose:LPS heptosyltransferase